MTDIPMKLKLICASLTTAVIIGCTTGLFGSVLWLALGWCSTAFSDSMWLVWLLPLGGFGIVLLYRKSWNAGDTNDVIKAVQNSGTVSGLMAPFIFAGTFLTRLFGGSVGSEGAAIQIGGSIASTTARLFRTPLSMKRIMLMAGISGGFASVVGTPVTAIVLALELTGVGIMYYEAILPCSISSIISYSIASAVGINFPHYEIHDIPDFSVEAIVGVTVLAALGGLVSIMLCRTLEATARLSAKWIPSRWFRVGAGGVAIAAATWLMGSDMFNGSGLDIIDAAVHGNAAPWDFLVKTAFTAVSLGTGFKGGAIVPTVATGAAFGGFLGPVIGLSPSLASGIGITSVLSGSINCPITAFMLGIEMFGTKAGLFFILSCAVGYACSGYYSLYPAQMICRSKLTSKTIERRAL